MLAQLFLLDRNSSGHIISAKSARSVWRTTFDPNHIPPPEASLTGLRDNPADLHTEKYELAMIDLFQHISDELTGEDGEQGFDIKFSTSRRWAHLTSSRCI